MTGIKSGHAHMKRRASVSRSGAHCAGEHGAEYARGRFLSSPKKGRQRARKRGAAAATARAKTAATPDSTADDQHQEAAAPTLCDAARRQDGNTTNKENMSRSRPPCARDAGARRKA